MKPPSIQSTLDRLKRVAKDRGVSANNILTEFLIERLAVRLTSDKDIAKHLTFKGGYVSLRVYGSPRYTTDLDAVVHHMSRDDIVSKIKDVVAQPFPDNVWFVYERSVDLETQNEYGGLRLVFRCGLGETPPGNVKRAQIINLDIGTGDPVTPAPQLETTTWLLGESSLSWKIYPPETIVAEKLHPFVTRQSANSRSKDLYDLSLLLPRTSADTLRAAVNATFAYRKASVPNSFADLLRSLDTTLLRRGWRAALVDIVPIPDFDKTLGEVISQLEKIKFWRQ
jgi:hypothetical protein